jgi:replication-associated recombination protein RarA
VAQSYRPAEVEGRRYYEPSPHGAEQEIARRMADRTEHHHTEHHR